jgi:streptomycin 6-kinase
VPSELPLPPAFVTNIKRHHGAPGLAWLRSLPSLVDRLAQHWSLTLEPHYLELSFSYVAAARRADGAACVLKISFPEPEGLSAIESLRIWNGSGVCRLLEASTEDGAVLLERLEPGTTLASLASEDDDTATLVTAGLMKTLWQSPPEPNGLISLELWFRELLAHRTRHGGAGRFPRDLLARGEDLSRELLASIASPVMLHGDLHHFNILRAEREPWLAIDPKGLTGEAGFEVAAFLRNPGPLPRALLSRRLDILTHVLGLDRGRTRDWCFAEAMLNACWSHDDVQKEFDRKIEWTELMLDL